MAIITISRLTGSGGREIATATAEALGFQLIDRKVMDAVIREQFPVKLEELTRIKKDQRVYEEIVRTAIAVASRDEEMPIQRHCREDHHGGCENQGYRGAGR